MTADPVSPVPRSAHREAPPAVTAMVGLIRGLVHVGQMVDQPDDLVPFLRQLGRDHRRFGVEPKHYEAIGTALLAAMKTQLGAHWTAVVEQAWAEAFTIIARRMQEAAA